MQLRLGCLAVALGLTTACGGGGGGAVSADGNPGPVQAVGPTISANPSAVSVATGERLSLEVAASGVAPLAYAWERSDDDGATWEPVPSATASTFTVEQTTLAWAQTKMRVRVSDGTGSVVSPSVQVDVRPTVRIIHGTTGGLGYGDGVPERVRYMFPHAVVANARGELFVADSWNQLIRKIAVDGSVSTVAGTLRRYGSIDGPAGAAMFNFPQSIALGAGGVLYVGDQYAVRRVDVDGRVSTIAGSMARGSADGTGSAARFSNITGLHVDRDGSLIVVDGGENQTVRRVTQGGAVSTVAGMAGVFGSADGVGVDARFRDLTGVIADPNGWLLVSDGSSLRKVDAGGLVTLFAGRPDASGRIDGPRLAARFYKPSAMAYRADGTLYLIDASYGGQLRRISASGEVSTLAGGWPSSCGDIVDGQGASASFAYVSAFAPLPDGRTFAFTDHSTSVIRTVNIDGEVRTISGAGQPPCAEPTVGGLTPTYGAPTLLTSDRTGNLYLPDGRGGLRIIAPDGQVSVPGWVGTALINARGLAVDSGGNLYYTGGHAVWKLDTQGNKARLAGTGEIGHLDGPGATAKFSFPTGIVIDTQGAVVVADGQNCALRRIAADGTVSTLAGRPGTCSHADGTGSAALFVRPEGLAIDRQGRILVADIYGNTIRRVSADGHVETLAGRGYAGLANGRGELATFHYPSALAVDDDGYIYVADLENSAIRRITPRGQVSTVIGSPGTSVLVPGVGGTINRPSAIAVTPHGRIAFTTEWAVVSD